MSDGFKLDDVVNAVLFSSTHADPAILAKEVAHRIDDADLRDALQQALLPVVYRAVSRNRFDPAPVSKQGTMPRSGATLAQGRSRKRELIRDWWRTQLTQRLPVGRREWKFLGDCTAEDLIYAATERDKQAAAMQARGDQLRALAGDLAASGAETVSALAILRGAA